MSQQPAVRDGAILGRGAALRPALRRALAQARFEARIVLRNGEQLLVTLVLPVIVLVVLSRTDLVELASSRSRIDVVAPGVLALAIMSSAFTSQAITTAFDRRNGVLRLMSTTPLGVRGLAAGKALAVLGVEVVQMLVLGGVALALGWRPEVAGIPAALGVAALGTAAFTALAILIAGTLRSEAVLAVANLLWVLLLIAGGAVLPASDLPEVWGAVVAILPSGALGDGLRGALLDGTAPALSWLVLAGWTTLLTWAATRAFRWD